MAWGAARLEPGAIERWRARHGLAGGLALLVAVSLLVGSVDAAVWADARLHRPAPWNRRTQVLDTLDWWLSRSPLPPDAQHELARNTAAWLDLQTELDGLPRPLGREAGYLVQGLGRALSTPYRRLAVWLPYSLLVLALSRALGGRASLPEMLGTSALYVAPHLLDLVGTISGLSTPIGLITFWWGAAIYVKATRVASGLDGAQAFIAAVAPAMAIVTLGVMVLAVAVALH